MRLTIVLLGHTFDLSLEPTVSETEGCSLDGGTTVSYPVGFSVWPVPAEADGPWRTPAWDEPEE